MAADRTGCLIAISGAIGSGKSTIAGAVSRRLDIPVHSIDDNKAAIGATYPGFDRWVADGIPFPDDFRRLVYERTLTELAALAEAQPYMIVEETFHRREIREPFFRAGAQIFGSVCVVEIAVAPEVAAAHLQKRASDESDHMAGREMFDAFALLYDPFDRADLIVRNDGELETAVDEVCAHLEVALGIG
ncbi:MAG: AAA family ATPase [Acidimicrobiales bacterium]